MTTHGALMQIFVLWDKLSKLRTQSTGMWVVMQCFSKVPSSFKWNQAPYFCLFYIVGVGGTAWNHVCESNERRCPTGPFRFISQRVWGGVRLPGRKMPWEHEMLLPCDAAGHQTLAKKPASLAWILVDSAGLSMNAGFTLQIRKAAEKIVEIQLFWGWFGKSLWNRKHWEI